METKKKKLSKKAVIIGSVVLAVVLVVGVVVGVIIHKNARPIDPDKVYTFDEVTMGLSKKISYAVERECVSTPDQASELLVKERINEYKSCYYVYSDEALRSDNFLFSPGTLISHLVFYDKNDKYIFETFEYSYGYVRVIINGEHSLYQVGHSK